MNKKLCVLLPFLLFVVFLNAQNEDDKYELIAEVKITPTKNQQNSNTCWSYATVSFLESELLRTQNKEYDLSENYYVYLAYLQKADKYIRLNGASNVSPGGQAHDVINLLAGFGAYPQNVYEGKAHKYKMHNHEEFDYLVKHFLQGVLKAKSDTLCPQWKPAFEGILDSYLGDLPAKFEYNQKEITPQQFFNDELNLNPSDYVELTTFEHHPFYETFDLEVPDNWSSDAYYNIPLDELSELVKNSIKLGYSVVWDGDVSEETFVHNKCIAYIDDESGNAIDLRQENFDNQTTTDDHLMHLYGLYSKNGKMYFKIKNSWGKKSNKENGSLYMSEDYFKLKTIAIMVHKAAIPQDLKNKLNIKD